MTRPFADERGNEEKERRQGVPADPRNAAKAFRQTQGTHAKAFRQTQKERRQAFRQTAWRGG
jgi:hypothetical protein